METNLWPEWTSYIDKLRLSSSMDKKMPIRQGACLHLEVIVPYYHMQVQVL